MTYTPAVGDRVLVRRTRSIHGGTGTITGLILNILTIDGIPGILHLQADGGGRVYLATNAQMAAIGKTQTIERAPN